MSRIIAFGCSYTYGHGLPDCHIEPDWPGNEPSKLAWPSLLGQMLDLEVVNQSNPGASNLHILWKLINFDFATDDVCVVMWTYFSRMPYTTLKYDSSIIEYEDMYEAPKGQNTIEEENLIINNYIVMHHAYLHLLEKNVKQCFIIGPKEGSIFKKSPIEIPSLVSHVPVLVGQVDKALDKKHPGIKTQAIIANYLVDKINVIR